MNRICEHEKGTTIYKNEIQNWNESEYQYEKFTICDDELGFQRGVNCAMYLNARDEEDDHTNDFTLKLSLLFLFCFLDAASV